MKRVFVFIAVASLMVALFASCRSHPTCPAYNNGSSDKGAPVENTKA